MAIIKDLYDNKIDRPLNPAVSAEDFSDETVKTEIDEYVFTDEIINGLYNVLSHIMKQDVSHNGIWINGFFGSGKSHFLKYLGYCINPKYRDAALDRLMEAVKMRDPMQVPDSKSEVYIADMQQMSQWLRKATIDVVLFNIGTVHDTNSDQRQVFTQVFWNQFNRYRGYNSFNLALAQNLEKMLDREGKFDEFKSRLSAKGFDWSKNASMLAKIRLDMILEIAKELVPDITIDSIRQSIKDNRENVSPEAFCSEIQEHIELQNNPNYRLLFLVDEVSQFINDQKGLMLQLQEVVTGLHNHCKDQAWVACTAQQDLSELMSNMQIVKSSDDYGKIMGRFEVRVSLKGTQTEYITQKRLLEKNAMGEATLKQLYDDKRLAIENQFTLPTSFHAFTSQDDFIGYYPFVPYQFSLIMKVLDSFGKLRYIDSQSRGNERSIIKITHSTAIAEMNREIGKFISFDKFYNAMFQGSLMASGQRSIENANRMVREYEDADFAQRVVNVLFMICNLDSANKLIFPATLENIVTLLMEDVDTNKAVLINRVEQTLAFLDQKHIIRLEKTEFGNDVYCFQSEDEIDAAREIDSIQVDTASMAKLYYDMVRSHFGVPTDRNRESYCTRNFSVGWTVLGKNYFSNNADIQVDFPVGANPNGTFGFRDSNTLTFEIGKEIAKDKLLGNDIFWYCQVQKFISQGASTKQREKTIESFRNRAADVYAQRIFPKIGTILNKCEILSGDTSLNITIGGPQRYKAAIDAHFARVYEYAKLVNGDKIPRSLDALREAILRKSQPGEYGPMNPLTEPEQLVEQYINAQPIKEVYVSEVLRNFASRPYGWSEFATAYIINELRRRSMRSLKYNNDSNIDSRVIAQNITKEPAKFTIIPATTISQALINEFIEAWKKSLNQASAPSAYDPGELYRLCHKTEAGEKHVSIASALASYRERRKELSQFPFVATIDEVIALLEGWDAERDHKKFFELVIAEQGKATEIIDRCKVVVQFATNNLAAYKQMLKFIDDNRNNFDFVENKAKVEELRGVVTDAWPFPNMVHYGKTMRELQKELQQITEAKRNAVKKAYDEVFEELALIAAENGVEYKADKSVVMSKTHSDNLYVLKNNVDVSDYRAEQVQWIMTHKPTPPTPPGPGPDPVPPTPPKPHTIKMVTLKTGSTKVLKTVEDIDAYLSGLRKQLIDKLANRKDNEDIMVK